MSNSVRRVQPPRDHALVTTSKPEVAAVVGDTTGRGVSSGLDEGLLTLDLSAAEGAGFLWL